MKGKYPLTRARLHRALLDLLMHKEVHLTYTPLKYGGHCEWDEVFPPTNIRIRVDANSGDDIKFVIHELLHVIFHPIFVGRVDDTLEEVCIIALDTYMHEYVDKSPERLTHWRRLVTKKLEEGMVDVPIAVMADRS